jgi:hypothetical protein
MSSGRIAAAPLRHVVAQRRRVAGLGPQPPFLEAPQVEGHNTKSAATVATHNGEFRYSAGPRYVESAPKTMGLRV